MTHEIFLLVPLFPTCFFKRFRSCATEFANAGAGENQMRNKFNWKNASMAIEYIANSESTLKRNADLLTKGDEKRIKEESPESGRSVTKNRDENFEINAEISKICDENVMDEGVKIQEEKTENSVKLSGSTKRMKSVFENMQLNHCTVNISYASNTQSQ